jgi:hypothetical protein
MILGAEHGLAEWTTWVYDLEARQCQVRLATGRPTAMAVAPDACQALIAGEHGGKLCLWDLGSGRPIVELAREARVYERTHCVAVSPCGKLGASGSADGSLRVWDLESGACIAHSILGRAVMHCAFTLDGSRIVATDVGGEVHIYELMNRQRGLPVVVALRLWRFAGRHLPTGTRPTRPRSTVVCPNCGRESWIVEPCFVPTWTCSECSGTIPLTGDGVSWVRKWQFITEPSALPAEPGHWDDEPTAPCPHCGTRFPVAGGPGAQEADCGQCGGRVILAQVVSEVPHIRPAEEADVVGPASVGVPAAPDVAARLPSLADLRRRLMAEHGLPLPTPEDVETLPMSEGPAPIPLGPEALGLPDLPPPLPEEALPPFDVPLPPAPAPYLDQAPPVPDVPLPPPPPTPQEVVRPFDVPLPPAPAPYLGQAPPGPDVPPPPASSPPGAAPQAPIAPQAPDDQSATEGDEPDRADGLLGFLRRGRRGSRGDKGDLA